MSKTAVLSRSCRSFGSSISQLHCNSNTVAQRHKCGEQLGGVVEQAVELENGVCGLVGRSLLSGCRSYLAAPENIIGDEQAAAAQARHGHTEYAGIVFLVHVVENNVHFRFLFGKQFECVAHQDLHAVADPGAVEIATGLLGIAGIAVGVEDATSFAQGARPPDGGITDGRAHLEHSTSLANPGDLVEEAADSRTYNGYVPLCGLGLHFRQHGIAGRQNGVEVMFDVRVRDPAHGPGRATCISHATSFLVDQRQPTVWPGLSSMTSMPRSATLFFSSAGLPVSAG